MVSRSVYDVLVWLLSDKCRRGSVIDGCMYGGVAVVDRLPEQEVHWIRFRVGVTAIPTAADLIVLDLRIWRDEVELR